MGIEVRGSSFRAKVYVGRKLVAQKTFPSWAEAERFITATKFHAELVADHALWRKFVGPAQAAYQKATPLLGGTGLAPEEEAPGDPLRKLLERYRDEATPRKRGARQEAARLSQLMRTDLARRSIQELEKSDFQTYRNVRLTEVSPSTVRKEVATFSTVISHAREEWGLKLAENPAQIRHPKNADVQRDRRLVGDEEERLLAAADDLTQDAIVLALDTCMRRGELLALTPAMIYELDTDRAHVVLPKEVTKTNRQRSIPLTPRAVDVIARRISTRDAVLLPFVSAAALTLRFIKITKRAGISDLTFHDLRHEATSRLVASKRYSDVESMSISGHESYAMFKRYVKPEGGELASRMRK